MNEGQDSLFHGTIMQAADLGYPSHLRRGRELDVYIVAWVTVYGRYMYFRSTLVKLCVGIWVGIWLT